MVSQIACPRCGSSDTVSYWAVQDKQPKQPGALSSVEYIYRAHWPDRRICVDCDVQWNPRDLERSAHLRRLVSGK